MDISGQTINNSSLDVRATIPSSTDRNGIPKTNLTGRRELWTPELGALPQRDTNPLTSKEARKIKYANVIGNGLFALIPGGIAAGLAGAAGHAISGFASPGVQKGVTIGLAAAAGIGVVAAIEKWTMDKNRQWLNDPAIALTDIVVTGENLKEFKTANPRYASTLESLGASDPSGDKFAYLHRQTQERIVDPEMGVNIVLADVETIPDHARSERLEGWQTGDGARKAINDEISSLTGQRDELLAKKPQSKLVNAIGVGVLGAGFGYAVMMRGLASARPFTGGAGGAVAGAIIGIMIGSASVPSAVAQKAENKAEAKELTERIGELSRMLSNSSRGT